MLWVQGPIPLPIHSITLQPARILSTSKCQWLHQRHHTVLCRFPIPAWQHIRYTHSLLWRHIYGYHCRHRRLWHSLCLCIQYRRIRSIRLIYLRPGHVHIPHHRSAVLLLRYDHYHHATHTGNHSHYTFRSYMPRLGYRLRKHYSIRRHPWLYLRYRWWHI